LSLRYVCIFEIYVKILIFVYPTWPILRKKILDPYFVKPNLTLLEQSSASAWILDLEFFQKYFWASQADRQQDTSSHFLHLKNRLNLTVVIGHPSYISCYFWKLLISFGKVYAMQCLINTSYSQFQRFFFRILCYWCCDYCEKVCLKHALIALWFVDYSSVCILCCL
jgi:hypothetical protein